MSFLDFLKKREKPHPLQAALQEQIQLARRFQEAFFTMRPISVRTAEHLIKNAQLALNRNDWTAGAKALKDLVDFNAAFAGERTA
jgi:hypothetical protein